MNAVALATPRAGMPDETNASRRCKLSRSFARDESDDIARASSTGACAAVAFELVANCLGDGFEIWKNFRAIYSMWW